jgi:hypothetical protein
MALSGKIVNTSRGSSGNLLSVAAGSRGILRNLRINSTGHGAGDTVSIAFNVDGVAGDSINLYTYPTGGWDTMLPGFSGGTGGNLTGTAINIPFNNGITVPVVISGSVTVEASFDIVVES